MKKKICFIASSGGHFEQLMMLKPLMEKYESFIVTEKTNYKVTTNLEKIYYLNQVNRKERVFIFKFLSNFWKSWVVYRLEKPNIVISTGALTTIPMCLIVKICGGKVIFIESFAKVTSPTLTGKLIYKIANQFYVQWPEMLEIYSKAIYKGGLY